MGKTSDLRICVRVNGHLSRLLSIFERKGGTSDGDLVITLATAEKQRIGGNCATPDAPLITHEKYSAHCSPNSGTGVNCLVRRANLSNESKVESRHYTKAIKSRNKYAVVFSARAQDLSIDRYRVQPKGTEIAIDTYDTRFNTLYYQLLISSADSPTLRATPDFNVRRFQFRQFSLTVMWCFAPITSHSTEMKYHSLTFDRTDTEWDSRVTFPSEDGLDGKLIRKGWKINRSLLHKEFRAVVTVENVSAAELDHGFSRPFSISPQKPF